MGPASSERHPLLAGVWGCPPGIIFPPSAEGPFLARKGKAAHLGRTGIVEKVFHHPVRASVIG